jgi:nucleoid-associated protein YgaU
VFAFTSRYYNLKPAALKTTDGRTIIYVPRRFAPQPDSLTLLQEHVVVAGDRLDNLAAQYLDDPEQFWRIADANNAMQPDDLTRTAGSVLRITLPEGVPGAKNA